MTELLMVTVDFFCFLKSLTFVLLFTEVQENGTDIFLSTFTFSQGRLTQTVIRNGYQDISQLKLETIRLFGAPSGINNILVNGVRHTNFEIRLPDNELHVHNLNIPVNSEYIISFSADVTTTTSTSTTTRATTTTTTTAPPNSSVLFTCSWILLSFQLSYNLFIFVKNV